MKKTLLTISACALLFAGYSCTEPKAEAQADLTQYVDPYIGSGGHGHVFVGANVPWGMVQLGPSSIPQEWDWTSGYHISDSTVIGFPHMHLSGTGIGDLHDITLMPVTGEVKYARGVESDPTSGLWSYSDRSKEVVKPGYYATHLLRYGVDVELTATKRVGFHKYTFNQPENAAVVFDLQNGGCWDSPTKAYIAKTGEKTIEGYRYSSGWANDQRVFFVAEFSQPITSMDVMVDRGEAVADKGEGKIVYARANVDAKEPVYVKVALSPTSIENAKLNMQTELPGWDFEGTINAADQAWEKALAKVEMESSCEKTKKIFYTALYHTMVAPSEFCDVNGDYYGADHQMH